MIPSLLALLALLGRPQTPDVPFRPPAVPLVVHDPYFSIWSPADKLTDAATVHWTGRPHRLTSLVRVDGKTFRVLGNEPADVPPLPQLSTEVLPTRTICRFADATIKLTLTFTTPALPDDLKLLSRPLTYLTWEIGAADGKRHDVDVYLDASAEIAVDEPGQEVVESLVGVRDLAVVSVRSRAQPVLEKSGDDRRIDWGDLQVAMPRAETVSKAFVPAAVARAAFREGRPLPGATGRRLPETRPVRDGWPVLAVARTLGAVDAAPVACRALVGYDDEWSIQYFGARLRARWNHPQSEFLFQGERDHAAILERCRAFDEELMADLTAVGGKAWAQIAALAYRQCLAGNKLCADRSGAPLLFPKENSSNGCIATVDVIYPMAPLFLLFSLDLAKAMLVPPLDYALSARWKFPFAPHDLGTYPHATGQVYGGGETGERDQMPVEECGNLLLLVAAVARAEGDAQFAGRWWPALRQWALYLEAHGRDPENQLCTDDFTGHLAHNVNLSLKAILALGAYAQLCERRGLVDESKRFRATAERYAAEWIKRADDGDHFRLAFDKPGTWSQKYNLVWDRVLDLRLFPADVSKKEMAFYRTVQQRYGLPLDGRAAFTKSDWTLWTATLTGDRADFDALVGPIWRYLHETQERVPFCDWHRTDTGHKVNMIARPVVGAIFLPMLMDEKRWQAWVRRGSDKARAWAPFPVRAVCDVPTAATALTAASPWRYAFDKPPRGWEKAGFDDRGWGEGNGGFGAAGTPGAVVGTEWKSGDVWLRRHVRLREEDVADPELMLRVHHDEETDVYVDGNHVAHLSGYTTDYVTEPLFEWVRATLAKGNGRHLLAVHCRQTTGGQYVDVGFARPMPAATVPAPGTEDRAAAAGWRVGSTWFEQHDEACELARDHPPDVVLLGDSITQGFGGGRQVAAPGGEAFTRWLAPKKAANFGISGDRTQQVLWRLEHSALAGIKPRLVVVAIGTNNLTAGDSPEDTAAGIAAIVQRLQKRRVDTLVLSILPRGEQATDPMRARVAAVNAELSRLQSSEGHVRVLDLTARFVDAGGAARRELYAGDFLHLSAAGYEVLAQALAEAIGK